MTATDELRRLLDERGVEYDGHLVNHTTWASGNAVWAAHEYDGKLDVWIAGGTINDLTPQQAIDATLGPRVSGEMSDGYHTFNELYHHRAMLFSVIVRDHSEVAWKSRQHHDGTMYDGMFIVGVDTPLGQATYHYDIDPYWEMFECKELERAPEWDGHTPDEAISRIATLGREEKLFSCPSCGVEHYDSWLVNTANYCPHCGMRW